VVSELDAAIHELGLPRLAAPDNGRSSASGR